MLGKEDVCVCRGWGRMKQSIAADWRKVSMTVVFGVEENY